MRLGRWGDQSLIVEVWCRVVVWWRVEVWFKVGVPVSPMRGRWREQGQRWFWI